MVFFVDYLFLRIYFIRYTISIDVFVITELVLYIQEMINKLYKKYTH